MKKRFISVISLLLMLLSAECHSKENVISEENIHPAQDVQESVTNSEDSHIMDGMQELLSWNTYGFLFGIYSDLSKGQVQDGIIELEHGSDNLYFLVESAGQQREIAVQIFIDYVQVPIIIDGEEYLTFFIDADEKFSQEYCFVINKELDESVDHKLTAVMTVATDKNAANVEGEYPFNDYSIAYDEILDIQGNSDQIIPDSLYDYEEPHETYKDMWYGLIINDDTEEFRRKVPEKEITVEPDAEIELQYQVGGYEDCSEVLFLVSLDMQQIPINNQNFLKLQVTDGKISNGILKLRTPSEPGLYDLTGWIIKDPFSEKAPKYTPLDAAYRFTLNVRE